MNKAALPHWSLPITLDSGRAALQAYQDWSEQAFVTADIEFLLTDRSRFIDELLAHLFEQYQLPTDSLALIAVGGYGRGTLHPYSDIDLLFLTQTEQLDQQLQQRLASLVQLLWDLRLDIGHSIRTTDQCIEQAAADITVATSLLEQRHLAGNAELSERFQQQIYQNLPWSSRAFYQAKVDEQKQRHLRFHGTSYNLEPNIKSSPGGLRDIQTISWIAKRHFKTQSDESLVLYGYITAAELLELREQQLFLWRLRFALHLEAAKSENRLLFDFQVGVAAQLGYGQGKQAVEALMKDYFNAAAVVSELNAMLLQFFEQAILATPPAQTSRLLDQDFQILDDAISARHDHVFEQPSALLKLPLLIAQTAGVKTIQAHTIRLLRNARRQLQQPLCSDAACRELFMQWLRHPNGCGYAFQVMHQHRILAHYLPAWQQIVGQMQFDLFHAYTVDEHTFRLVRNLYRYSEPERAEDFPLCTSIVAQMKQPELLYLAGIFHDIAKGRGGDHSELGEQDARNFALLHHLPTAQADLVAWLVRHHLLMSITAQKQDIHDPEVVGKFAALVATQQRLDYLYCLTVADIRATNSSLWNNWKASLLENLYHATTQHFTNSAASSAQQIRQQIQLNKAHAMGLLLSAGCQADAVEALWARFTADYFLRHPAEQIAWHTQHILQIRDHELLPLILIGDENNQGTTELFLYDHEQAHLFAAVAAVLDSQNLSIHDAQILATRDGFIMDTFVVLQADGEPLTDTRQIEALKQSLHDVLRGRTPAPNSRRRLPRRLRTFQVTTKVEFTTQIQKQRTTMELTTLDRPGLVARVARVLQQLDLNILAAKITTVGEQAQDFFILTTRNHAALNETQQQQLRERICAVLQPD